MHLEIFRGIYIQIFAQALGTELCQEKDGKDTRESREKKDGGRAKP